MRRSNHLTHHLSTPTCILQSQKVVAFAACTNMKLLVAICAAAAAGLAASQPFANSCTITADTATGLGDNCNDAAKCVNSLSVFYTGMTGTVDLPASCAVSGQVTEVTVIGPAITAIKGNLTLAYTAMGGRIELSATLDGDDSFSCVSDVTVTAGTCLGTTGPNPAPSPSASARPSTSPSGASDATSTFVSVFSVGLAVVALSIALFL